MSSPDKPFVLRGGSDEQSALHNRITAIDRIIFLSGIDLRKKSATYLKALDMELWTRWYKNEPASTKVDETFCQRAAEVVCAMEGKDFELKEDEYRKAKGEHDARRNIENSGKDAGQTEQVQD
jgi:hypothetical protein